MYTGLATHVDAIGAELAVAHDLIRPDLLAVLLEVRDLLVGFHRREHVGEVLDVALVRELGIALGARRAQVRTAELRVLSVLSQLDDLDVHLAHERAHGIMSLWLVEGDPAILYGHPLALVIR